MNKHNLRVTRVYSNLVHSHVTDYAPIVGERDVRGCRTITLVVGKDFYMIVFPDTNTTVKHLGTHSAPTKLLLSGNKNLRVDSAEIDTDSF